ncbi:unnamed protein product [Phytophthora lilii]|uniref:Unnamed protein product n=1 Tax=Phytophthora lilii TaxID=2077276 RepID=A0A9W6U232_9STRA|nr:unnamed protein product [Phytophthora lilii]
MPFVYPRPSPQAACFMAVRTSGALRASVLSGEGWAIPTTSRDQLSHSWKECSALQALVIAAEKGVDNKANEESQDEESDAPAPVKKKRVYKKRKSTHTVRKEEKQALEQEIRDLESKLESLKLQKLKYQPPFGSGQGTGYAYRERKTSLARHVSNRGVHSSNGRSDRTPQHTPLLAWAKASKRKTVYRAAESRPSPLRELFPRRALRDPEGDFCSVQFDRTALHDVRGGIRTVSDAFKDAAFNAEILVSETSDNVTIREDDGLVDEMFSQLRLVTHTTHGVEVESNLAYFSDFSHVDDSGRKYALITTDFVNQDELYPYRPNERLRRESIMIVLVTAPGDTPVTNKSNEDGGHEGQTSGEEGEAVLVITRWTFTRLCHSDLDVPDDFLRGMRDLSRNTIMNYVHETVSLSKTLTRQRPPLQLVSVPPIGHNPALPHQSHCASRYASVTDTICQLGVVIMASIGAHFRGPRAAAARAFPAKFQRQDSAEDESEAYGADRHAAAALRGFSVRAKDEKDEKVKLEPVAETSDVEPKHKPAKKKRVYKKRKATHTIRKEEKQALEVEIEKLQKELELLKFKTLVQNGETAPSDKKRRAQSALLREAVQEQHLVLARAQAMLAGHSQQSLYRLHPTEMKIRLGLDRDERMRTLTALRGPKLQNARRFLMERTRGLSPTIPYFQEERYDTADGDYCVARFDVTPFRGAKGVQEVFAALQQAVFNAEIIISESSGNITIRDDDDLGDENLSHMRFVSQTQHGVQLETNIVLFSDCAQCKLQHTFLADDGRYAIMASDFVDEDERYPYRPNERIRRDSTTVTMVTSYRDNTDVKSEGEGDLVVVVTRWALTIVRNPAIPISGNALDDLRNSQVRWADMMFNCVRQALAAPVVQ